MQLSNRFVEHFLAKQRSAQIVVGLSVSSIDSNGFSKVRKCLVLIYICVEKDVTQIIVGFGVSGIDTESLAIFGDSFCELSLLTKRHTQSVVIYRVSGIYEKRCAVFDNR